jgi:hypothetical protein
VDLALKKPMAAVVTAVPMLAPMMTPTDWLSIIMPPLMKPTTPEVSRD